MVVEDIVGLIWLMGYLVGGYLVLWMGCEDMFLFFMVMNWIDKIVSISGVYDFCFLLWYFMNEKFGLMEEIVYFESFLFKVFCSGFGFIVWVGVCECLEFFC